MAKKKTPDINSKSYFKKPIKTCEPAIDDLKRIRRNEQAQLYRLRKKFDNTKKKTVADDLRRKIKAKEKAIDYIGNQGKKVTSACNVINATKQQNKSLRAQNASITRKFKQWADSKGKGYNEKEFRALQAKRQSNSNKINANLEKIKGELYAVNKGLGFQSIEVAEKLNISKKNLEKQFAKDFPEGYFDELEAMPAEDAEDSADGGFIGSQGKEIPDEELSDELIEAIEEGETDSGYIVALNEVFWQVQQDWDKNEKAAGLSQYKRITFEWNGQSQWFSGNNLSMIALTAGDAFAWAASQPPYVSAIKMHNADFTKLKYIFYRQ